jgi:serine protease Do
MKKFIAGFLTCAILLFGTFTLAAGSLTAYYNNDIKLRVNDEFVNIRAVTAKESGQENGFNLFPVRALGEALGYKVEYDPKTKIIDLDKPTVESVTKEVIDSCVMIRCFVNDQYVAYGSGVVYNGYIITNKHVLDQGTSYTVEYNGSTQQYYADRVTVDTVLDIGILKSPIEAKSVVLGDSSNTNEGREIISISSPHELKNTVSTGLVSAFRNVYGIDYMQVNTNAYPGESGGGLFDMEGKLIAITAARLLDGEDLNMAVPIDDVKKILNGLK